MWMCDRCQSINDASQSLCPRCGAAPLKAGERPSPPAVDTPAEPAVFVPQFGRPVTAQFGHAVTESDIEGGPSPAAAPAQSIPDSAPVASPGESPATKIAVGVGIGVFVVMLLGRLLNPVRLLFVALGVGLFFFGHYLGERTAAFRKTAVRVSGRVARLDQSGSGGDVYYYPVVDFLTREGVPTEFRDSQGARPPQNHVGETVTVYYNPLAPTDAQVDSPVSHWIPIGMYVFGALIILAAIGGSSVRRGGDGDLPASF